MAPLRKLNEKKPCGILSLPVPLHNYQRGKGSKMANEIFEGESLSLELTRFLDKNVGTEKSSAASINCLLKDILKKKKCLETEVSDLG